MAISNAIHMHLYFACFRLEQHCVKRMSRPHRTCTVLRFPASLCTMCSTSLKTTGPPAASSFLSLSSISPEIRYRSSPGKSNNGSPPRNIWEYWDSGGGGG